jgi:hypothetical protein
MAAKSVFLRRPHAIFSAEPLAWDFWFFDPVTAFGRPLALQGQSHLSGSSSRHAARFLKVQTALAISH